MGTNQETLIYIEDKDKLDASVAANAFAHSDVKNRVYINALGAKLGMKYLASENIDVSNVYNLHSIKKILEEIDIADIMLSNIHIDVRVVYDENAIFIPKSHFELGLTPDIYLVFQLAKDFSCVTFLGFFEPSLINKNNANADYYFIEKEKLSPVASLKNFITNFRGNTNLAISDSEIENSERIIMAMADNDVSENDKKYLIKQLAKSAELRDKFIEYENFETLSYKAMTDSMITKKEVQEDNITNFSALENIEGLEDIQSIEEPNTEQELNQVENLEDISLDDIFKDDIESLGNIGNVENTETEVKDIANDSSNTTSENNAGGSGLSDIAGTVAGTTAGAIAGATVGGAISATAGEILSSINTAETAIDTVGEVAKAVNGVADVVSDGINLNKTENLNTSVEENKNETVSLNDIDTSSIVETLQGNENIENETISLNDVDTSGIVDVSQDQVNIENETISLNDVDTSSIVSTPQDQENIENETISLNDVDFSDIVNTDFIDTIDNKISFDDVNLQNQGDDILDTQSLAVDEPDISLNDIDTSALNDDTSNDDKDSLNVDNDLEKVEENIEPPLIQDEINTGDNADTKEEVQNALTEEDLAEAPNTTDELGAVESFDENDSIPLNEPDDFDFENFDNIEPLENNATPLNEELISENVEGADDEFDLNSIDGLIEPEITENPIEDVAPTNEKVENKTSNGFGDALLENLSNEELENIAIDDLGINDNANENSNVEDISSSDLLSQIDDVLNTSTTQGAPVEPLAGEMAQSVEDSSNITNNIPPANTSDSDDLSIEDLLGELNEDSATSNLISDEKSTNEVVNTPMANQEVTTQDDREDGNLEMLFSDTDTESDMDIDENPDMDTQTIPGQALFPQQKKANNKKTLIVAAALAAVVAASSAVMVLKPKNDSTSDIDQINSKQNEIVNDKTSEPSTTSAEDMLSTNTPNITKDTAQVAQTKQQVKELKNTAMSKKHTASGSYLQVNKLVWNVPDNLAYSPKMQSYLRTTGKSLKVALSTDLLSASEYAYTNQMKVNVTISSNGDIQQTIIGSSSGSTQIDNIVLQSVKDTLSGIKPPVDEIKGQSFNLGLIIYF